MFPSICHPLPGPSTCNLLFPHSRRIGVYLACSYHNSHHRRMRNRSCCCLHRSSRHLCSSVFRSDRDILPELSDPSTCISCSTRIDIYRHSSRSSLHCPNCSHSYCFHRRNVHRPRTRGRHIFLSSDTFALSKDLRTGILNSKKTDACLHSFRSNHHHPSHSHSCYFHRRSVYHPSSSHFCRCRRTFSS